MIFWTFSGSLRGFSRFSTVHRGSAWRRCASTPTTASNGSSANSACRRSSTLSCSGRTWCSFTSCPWSWPWWSTWRSGKSSTAASRCSRRIGALYWPCPAPQRRPAILWTPPAVWWTIKRRLSTGGVLGSSPVTVWLAGRPFPRPCRSINWRGPLSPACR